MSALSTFAKATLLVGSVLGIGVVTMAAPSAQSSDGRADREERASNERLVGDVEPDGGLQDADDLEYDKVEQNGTNTTAVTSISYGSEYSWCQNGTPVGLGSTTNRVCFLTYVTGDFEGGGEYVRVYTSGGYWYLGGYSYQTGVCAKARCLTWN